MGSQLSTSRNGHKRFRRHEEDKHMNTSSIKESNRRSSDIIKNEPSIKNLMENIPENDNFVQVNVAHPGSASLVSTAPQKTISDPQGLAQQSGESRCRQ